MSKIGGFSFGAPLAAFTGTFTGTSTPVGSKSLKASGLLMGPAAAATTVDPGADKGLKVSGFSFATARPAATAAPTVSVLRRWLAMRRSSTREKFAAARAPPSSAAAAAVPSARDLPPLPPAAQPPQGAIVGESLRDFKWIDSTVTPAGAAPEIQNIQELAPRIMCCVLRHRAGWHDGDRTLKTGRYAQKARAEMCCLGGNTPYAIGSTWLIGTTFRVNPDFTSPKGFCQLMQPVLHQSYLQLDKISGDDCTASLRVFTKGLGSASKVVRTIRFKRGQWVPVVLRVTFGPNGEYALSHDGDGFQGIRLDTSTGHVKGATVGKVNAFGGTWGLYMAAKGHKGDAIVQHANMFIKKIA